jgi:flagellar basal-body rod protein FlgG
MIRALWTAASGMSAQQLNVDTIANNLANVNTTGFKKIRVDYQDLYYQTIREPGAPQSGDTQSPAGIQVGLGVRPAATQKIMTQGEEQRTDAPLDVSVEGTGFFKVTMPDGTTSYTRAGALQMDSSGRLVTSEGYPLDPVVTVPADTQDVIISSDGTVSVRAGGSTAPTAIGNIELATFANPAGLKNIGHNLMVETPASGTPVAGAPGVDGLGTVQQGILEMSNVQVVEEMVTMITAQRAYELSSKAVQVADEMVRLANNIRG